MLLGMEPACNTQTLAAQLTAWHATSRSENVRSVNKNVFVFRVEEGRAPILQDKCRNPFRLAPSVLVLVRPGQWV